MDFFQQLGIKINLIAAGIAGGVVSLSYIKNLSMLSAMSAVVSGGLSAAYLTPPVVQWLNIENLHNVDNAAAFFIGLTGMHLIPMLISISENFREKHAQNTDKGVE